MASAAATRSPAETAKATAEGGAADPERRRHFPGLLTDADAAELPHLAALADRWTELTEDYDASGRLGAVIDGLLARTARPEPSEGM
ncbi:hypothetical protein IPZ68_25490 [Streptomyces arenae]|nr:hypothetical protein [Streptomyces arenae]